MFRFGMCISAFALLSACADPLKGVPRLSDIDLADSEPVAQALPTDAEVVRDSFFSADPDTLAPRTVENTVQPRQNAGGFLGWTSLACSRAPRTPVK